MEVKKMKSYIENLLEELTQNGEALEPVWELL